MLKNDELIARYERSRAEMIVHLDEIDLNRKIYPLWTVREILAHLSGWDDATIAFIRTILEGKEPGLTLAAQGIDVYNAESVATREGLDYDHIQREYLETRKVLLNLIRQVPEELVSKAYVLPWGGYGSLVDMVDIFAPHEVEHAKDVHKLIAAHQGSA
jgi:hypothetical protein